MISGPDVRLCSGQDVADAVKFLIRLAEPAATFQLGPTGYMIPELAWHTADVDWLAEARNIACAYGFELRQLHGSWMLAPSQRGWRTKSEEIQ